MWKYRFNPNVVEAEHEYRRSELWRELFELSARLDSVVWELSRHERKITPGPWQDPLQLMLPLKFHDEWAQLRRRYNSTDPQTDAL